MKSTGGCYSPFEGQKAKKSLLKLIHGGQGKTL